jgi:hydrogenase maturation protein HypF
MIVMRRARGFAPFPVRLAGPQTPVLALGAHLKNTVCLTKDDYAFLSQHLGDLDDAQTLEYLERTVEHFTSLLKMQPEVIACDRHPDYLSSRYAERLAEERGVPLVRVQHHHAHIASVMAERHVTSPVVGIACDGTGLGDDGRVWGCEAMVADFAGYRHRAHLAYVPLPGGERAIREPWRMGAVYLAAAFGPDFCRDLDIEFCRALDLGAWRVLERMIELGTNSPLASSAGRLFDAVAAITGVQQVCTYEGQAAMRLEAAATATERVYPHGIEEAAGRLIMDPTPVVRGVVDDLRKGVPVGEISGAFHNSFVAMLAEAAARVAEEEGLRQVALSGGTFQNAWVMTKLCEMLRDRGLEPVVHEHVPCNDGGLSLGQAAIAGALST